jgi:hypothetical protein
MDIIFIILGVVLIALGRRLFWLFVGVVGFVVGLNLAAQLVGEQPFWVILLLALLAGLLGSVLAVFLQRLMIAVAGFLAAGYVLLSLLGYFGVELGNLAWLGFLVGGVCGAILASLVFDWALVILSALLGATLMVQGLSETVPGFEPSLNGLLILVLFFVGIAIQTGYISRGRTRHA